MYAFAILAPTDLNCYKRDDATRDMVTYSAPTMNVAITRIFRPVGNCKELIWWEHQCQYSTSNLLFGATYDRHGNDESNEVRGNIATNECPSSGDG
jgi:hypothetical protein